MPLGGPAWAQELDKITSRGPVQAQPFCEFVIQAPVIDTVCVMPQLMGSQWAVRDDILCVQTLTFLQRPEKQVIYNYQIIRLQLSRQWTCWLGSLHLGEIKIPKDSLVQCTLDLTQGSCLRQLICCLQCHIAPEESKCFLDNHRSFWDENQAE